MNTVITAALSSVTGLVIGYFIKVIKTYKTVKNL